MQDFIFYVIPFYHYWISQFVISIS